MKITESPMCSFCNEVNETVVHFFWDCNITQHFWIEVFNWLKDMTQISITFSKCDILLGVNHKHNVIWSLIFVVGKKYLFKCKVNNSRPSIESFKGVIKDLETIEYNLAIKNNKINSHRRKWREIKF